MSQGSEVLLLYEIGLLVVVSSIASELFKRLRLPSLIGPILVGVFIGGPGGLGLVTDLTVINVLAVLGSVLILFTIGLEFEASAFMRSGKSAFLLTTSGVIVSMLAGYVIGLTLGWSPQAAFLLGVVIAPSGTSVISALLSSMGKVDTKTGSTLLTACIIDDVEGVLLLTIALNVITAKTLSASNILWAGLVATFFIVVSIFIGGRLFPTLIPRLGRVFSDEALSVVLLGLGLMLAFAATQVGLAAITGAFIMGAIIPYRKVGEKLVHRFFLTKEMFAAIFFTSVGLSINPYEIPTILPIALPVLAIALSARLIGGTIGAALAGFRNKALLTLATGLAIRAEMSLIIAREGVASGIVADEFLGLTAVLVIGSIIIILPTFSRITKSIR